MEINKRNETLFLPSVFRFNCFIDIYYDFSGFIERSH